MKNLNFRKQGQFDWVGLTKVDLTKIVLNPIIPNLFQNFSSWKEFVINWL